MRRSRRQSAAGLRGCDGRRGAEPCCSRVAIPARDVGNAAAAACDLAHAVSWRRAAGRRARAAPVRPHESGAARGRLPERDGLARGPRRLACRQPVRIHRDRPGGGRVFPAHPQGRVSGSDHRRAVRHQRGTVARGDRPQHHQRARRRASAAAQPGQPCPLAEGRRPPPSRHAAVPGRPVRGRRGGRRVRLHRRHRKAVSIAGDRRT